jgi:membrane-anchored protein YejM (alkaline phosphatase superfamily)
LFRETAANVDDMAFVRSVYAESDNHPAALFQFNTGVPVQGNPSIGSWVVYGLGTENQDWPAFVVLRDGKPFGGTSSWGNGYLPALYQGTQFRGGDHPVLNLHPPEGVTPQHQQKNLDLIQKLNRKHQTRHPDHLDLQAHIASYELAFRMQTTIPEAVDLASEPESIQKLYGLDNKETKTFGTRCLLARRMVERGVRFVQVWSGGWDSHADIINGHGKAAKRVDRPLAGLLKDLKQRGLLEETLVVWGGEFGRTVDTTEAAWNKKEPGRDHNPRAMTMWFAGGGIKGGSIVGATDEIGENAVDQRFHLRDVHATLLQLMGLDQEKLTYYHGGRFKRLTTNLVDGGGGEIIQDMLL